jgi:cation/acetate symporter
MDTQVLTTVLFLSVVAVTIGITVWASRQTAGAADYYAGGRQFTSFQNGLAIGGDYMSAASFLGISGIIALSGYDGFLYSIGFLVAWLVALLLVAEMLRNSGRFTMADQLAYRMRQRPVRQAAATSTVVVSIFYLLAQMVGAGALVSLLLDVQGDAAKNLTILAVGALMIFYVTVGGMKGTTWVQIVKAFLLMTGSALIVVLVLLKFDFNISDMLGMASDNYAARNDLSDGAAFLEPGLKYGIDTTSKIDFLSLGLALVLGTAGLPHILVRFYTVPTARDARKSVLWAIGLIGTFYLFTLVLGFGAAALLSDGKYADVGASGGNLASVLLAEEVGGGDGSTGGAVLLAVIAAVAFATILAVVAGLTLASSTSVAHDIYNSVVKDGQASEKDEIKVARIAAFVIGGVAILLAIPAKNLNVAFLVALAFAVAASANLPAIVYNMFWRGFNTRGAVWSIYGGLISSVGLVFSRPWCRARRPHCSPTTTGPGSR